MAWLSETVPLLQIADCCYELTDEGTTDNAPEAISWSFEREGSCVGRIEGATGIDRATKVCGISDLFLGRKELNVLEVLMVLGLIEERL